MKQLDEPTKTIRDAALENACRTATIIFSEKR